MSFTKTCVIWNSKQQLKTTRTNNLFWKTKPYTLESFNSVHLNKPLRLANAICGTQSNKSSILTIPSNLLKAKLLQCLVLTKPSYYLKPKRSLSKGRGSDTSYLTFL